MPVAKKNSQKSSVRELLIADDRNRSSRHQVDRAHGECTQPPPRRSPMSLPPPHHHAVRRSAVACHPSPRHRIHPSLVSLLSLERVALRNQSTMPLRRSHTTTPSVAPVVLVAPPSPVRRLSSPSHVTCFHGAVAHPVSRARCSRCRRRGVGRTRVGDSHGGLEGGI